MTPLVTARRCGAILAFTLALTPVLIGTVLGQNQKAAKSKPQVLLTEGDGWQTDQQSKTPQTLKALTQHCPEFFFTVKERKKADYFLLLDHTVESAKSPARYKFTLFDKAGGTLATAPPGGWDEAIKDACQTLRDSQKESSGAAKGGS